MTRLRFSVPAVSVKDLQARLNLTEPLDYPGSSLSKSLTAWKMEIDDAPIFRYLYRHVRPRRHLEFGTWEGTGVCYCLEECDATVWTINLLEGELHPDGSWAYGGPITFLKSLPSWLKRKAFKDDKGHDIVYAQTDALGFIGRHYLERRLGHRVCQIYCDSRQWDISAYPEGFFDSVLIDGGHSEEIVINDTRKALTLLRSGGLIMWHDFCPDPTVQAQCSSTRGVMSAVANSWDWLRRETKEIFWVNPSWILLGFKR